MKKIKPLRRCEAILRIPGSKSYTHRALIISSLAEGESVLLNPSKSEDTGLTLEALKKFGIPIFWNEEEVYVSGQGGMLLPPKERIFLGNSGTSMRFLTAFASLLKGRVLLEGDKRMKKRPMGELISSLLSLGVKVYLFERKDSLEVLIESKGLRGGSLRLRGKESSQFLSSLLIVGPYTSEGMEIEVIGDLVSKPYVDITLDVMCAYGIKVNRKGYYYFSIPSGIKYHPCRYKIETDVSSASYFFLAAAITGGRVRVESFNPLSIQGDIGFLGILKEMGCVVISGEDWVEVQGGGLRGIEVDMSNTPDLVPTLAVMAAFARGPTVIRNIRHLRFKESDRLGGLANELKKMGVKVEEGLDYLKIIGGTPRGAEIETYNDHRLAMSFAMSGLVVPEIRIKGEDCVKKSFPEFWEVFEKLYAEE